MKEDPSELKQLEKVNQQIASAKKTTGYVLCAIGLFVFIVIIAASINAKNLFLFIVGILEVAVLVGAGALLIKYGNKRQEKTIKQIGARIKEAHAHKKHTERKNVKRTRKKR